MNSSADVVIIGAARTPQGKLMGQLAPLSAVAAAGNYPREGHCDQCHHGP